MATSIFNIVMATLSAIVLVLTIIAKIRIGKHIDLGFIKKLIEFSETFRGIAFLSIMVISMFSSSYNGNDWSISWYSVFFFILFYYLVGDLKDSTLNTLNRRYAGVIFINEKAMTMSIDHRKGNIELYGSKFGTKCYEFDPIPKGERVKILYFDKDCDAVVQVVKQ